MSTVYSECRDKQSEACLASSPTLLSLCATFLLQRRSQGPMKGFTTEIGCPSNCQNHCQVLLSNSGTSFPSQNSEILHGLRKKKKGVHLYVCVIRVSVCVLAGSRGDSCFGLIYQCWYQRASLSEHIQESRLQHVATASHKRQLCLLHSSGVLMHLFCKYYTFSGWNLSSASHVHYWKYSQEYPLVYPGHLIIL